jgi:hypothetical protein
MPRPGADGREAKRLQELSDIARMKVDAEPFGNDTLEIDAPPPDDAIFLKVRAGLHDLRKLNQLFLRQARLGTFRPTSENSPLLPRILDGRARAGSRMWEDDWVWLKLARISLAEARFGALVGAVQRSNRSWAERCAREADRCLQRAWEEGVLTLRAFPTGGSRDIVEIPTSEAGNHRLDCPGSRIFRGRRPGRRLMDYHSVQVRKTDVHRLVAEIAGTQAAAASEFPAAGTKPQAAPDA